MALWGPAAAVLEAIYPPRCVACEGPVSAWAEALCPPCHDTIEPVPAARCAICGLPFESAEGGERPCGDCAAAPPAYAAARAGALYGGALEDALRAFKFGRRRDLAGYLVTETLRPLPEGIEGAESDLVVPVPLGRQRLRERRYDQAWLLARVLARELGLAAAPRALRRLRDTAPQTSLSAKARAENVRSAFAAGEVPGGLAGRRVLLVDDVMTTGATLSECARTLVAAGAAEVRAVTVARAI